MTPPQPQPQPHQQQYHNHSPPQNQHQHPPQPPYYFRQYPPQPYIHDPTAPRPPRRRPPSAVSVVLFARPFSLVIPGVIVVLNIWWSVSQRVCPSDANVGDTCFWLLWLSLPIVRLSLLPRAFLKVLPCSPYPMPTWSQIAFSEIMKSTNQSVWLSWLERWSHITYDLAIGQGHPKVESSSLSTDRFFCFGCSGECLFFFATSLALYLLTMSFCRPPSPSYGPSPPTSLPVEPPTTCPTSHRASTPPYSSSLPSVLPSASSCSYTTLCISISGVGRPKAPWLPYWASSCQYKS
ncbi:hypothetical protein AUP68_16029 [Ilyonectria robusta]